MQFSDKTLDVLNNFKTIQGNMVFREGSVIRTMAEARNIVASAEIDVDIPQDFGIYDLSEFLATLSLVDNPEIQLEDTHAVIRSTSGRSRVKYFFSDPAMLTAPTKSISMPSEDVKFTLDSSTLGKLKKAAATLGHEMMTITPNDGSLQLSIVDIENSSSNVFSMDIAGQYEGSFSLVFVLSNLKLIPVDYDVTISNKLISHFKSRDKDVPVEYWIALEKSSVVND